jgi:arylsulfatase A-like enzyme
MRTAGWIPLAALACGRPTTPGDGVTLPTRAYPTNGCRLASLAPARPHDGRALPAFLPPSRGPVDLTRAPAEVRGSPVPVAAPELRFEADTLATWETTLDGDRWFPSLPLTTRPDVDRVVVTLIPGGADWVEVVPSPGEAPDREDLEQRRVRVSVGDAPRDAPFSAVFSVEEPLSGNWGDDRRPTDGLGSFGIRLPASDPPARLVSVVATGPAHRFSEPAAVLTLERREILHPAWYVRGGSSVRFDVEVPPEGGVLRWYDAAFGRVSRAVTAGDLESRADDRGERWRARRLDLPGGGRVSVVLSAEGDGVAAFGAPRLDPVGPEPATPNVVLYLIDTLRADRVGAFGGTRPNLTPNLDRLASAGAAFTFTQSTSAWTKPAIPTLFTSVWPTTHGVGATSYTDRLPSTVPVIAERLRDAGWRTGSFSASPLGSTLSGLERGFDAAHPPVAWSSRLGPLGHPTAGQLHDAMLGWIDEAPDRPFFAYVHTLEVHGWRRAPYRDPAADLDAYDAAVADADRQLGALIGWFEERGWADRTLFVVVSDHGESFGDHGVSDHGTSLYQSQVHVPLLFAAGGSLPSVSVPDVTSLADVAPTILDLVGVEPLPNADGVSLAPYLRGPVATPVRAGAPSERQRFLWRPDAPKWYAWTRADGLKALRIGPRHEVFDVGSDPCESHSYGVLPADLQGELATFVGAIDTSTAAFDVAYPRGAAPVDGRDVELLRRLGYLD